MAEERTGAELDLLSPREIHDLPERFEEENLGIRFFKADELPDVYLDQLIAKSRQDHIMAHEGHEDVGTPDDPGRFRTREDYRAWAEGKDRYLYLITNKGILHDVEGEEVEDVGGIIWFGPREEERAPGYGLTFAIRLYAADEEQGWGRYHRFGLGEPFMDRTHDDIAQIFPGSRVWLDYVGENGNAGDLYARAGYREYDEFMAPHGDEVVKRKLMVHDMGEKYLPVEIEDGLFEERVGGNVTSLGEGIVNETFVATKSDGEMVVVQRLSPDMPPDGIIDQSVVTTHLAEQGWDMPILQPTRSDEKYLTDSNGFHWRAFRYIESDATFDPNQVGAEKYGALLGHLHRSLESSDYEPQFTIPHFHDTAHYAATLEARIDDIPTDEARAIAERALEVYRNAEELPDLGTQLIHADPKTSNILHKDGEPFTFIDWDTLMIGSPWIDLGDMIRSVAEERSEAGERVTADTIDALIDGYYVAYQPDMSPAAFKRAAYLAGIHITNELTMRFSADIYPDPDGYFKWDRNRFSSRAEHNYHRAAHQVATLEALVEMMPSDDGETA